MVWANSASGAGSDNGLNLAIDAIGNIYLSGLFKSHTFNLGGYVLTNPDTSDLYTDGFIAKYSSGGTAQWVKQIDGPKFENIEYVSLDPTGNVYVCGTFSSDTAIISSANLINVTQSGSTDIFVAKFDNAGNLQWARSMGGSGIDYVSGIATDIAGDIYVTGNYESTSMTLGSFTLNNVSGSGTDDIFVAKYNPSGNVIWALTAGGAGYDQAGGVAVNGINDLFVTGEYTSAPFPLGNTNLSSQGGADVFLARLGSVTGIATVEDRPSLLLYPNPASSICNIPVSDHLIGGRLMMIDLNGRVLFESELTTSNFKLQTSDLAAGIYMVKIINGEKEIISKLVVK